MKRNTITRRLGLYTLLGFLACSKDHGDRPGVARTAAGTVSDEKPAPFDAGPVKILDHRLFFCQKLTVMLRLFQCGRS